MNSVHDSDISLTSLLEQGRAKRLRKKCIEAGVYWGIIGAVAGALLNPIWAIAGAVIAFAIGYDTQLNRLHKN